MYHCLLFTKDKRGVKMSILKNLVELFLVGNNVNTQQQPDKKTESDTEANKKIKQLEILVMNLVAQLSIAVDELQQLNDRINILTTVNEEILYLIDREEILEDNTQGANVNSILKKKYNLN